MKALWKKFQVSAIAVSVCMLILGTVMLVWPEISAVTICVILGALCAAAGVYKLFATSGWDLRGCSSSLTLGPEFSTFWPVCSC